MENIILLVRLLSVFILSLIFGLERQKSHKPIGFGTFTFVAVGACALSIIASSVQYDNPLPLLGAIVTGVGFLGAGALIKTSDKIFGFTTASAIWIFAIFGIVVGIGEYFLALVAYILIWLITFVDRMLERKGVGSYQHTLVVTTLAMINQAELDTIFEKNKVRSKLISMDVEKGNKHLTLSYLIEGKKENINKIPQDLFKKDWLDSCKIK